MKIVSVLLLSATLGSCDLPIFENTIDSQQTDDSNARADDSDVTPITLYTIDGDIASKLQDYHVPTHLLDDQRNVSRHAAMWAYVTGLIPRGERGMIAQFEIFESDEIAGYVETRGSLNDWRMGMSVSLPNLASPPTLQGYYAYVLMHEFGHLLSLHSDQIDETVHPTACGGVVFAEGCAQPGTYIEAFFTAFWEDIYDDFEAMSEDAFFQHYRSHFLTSYAATHPLEDLAEAFAHFVFFESSPTDPDIAYEKVRFFYQYPELIRIRQAVRSNGAASVAFRSAPKIRCGRKNS